VAGTFATRASFTPGAGTTIPLLNPQWSFDYGVAFSVPYLNPAAFRLPNTGEFGNTPRYLPWLRGPKTINEDMSILKNFNVTEKKYFELRASASNVFNRVVIGGPTTAITSSTFGMHHPGAEQRPTKYPVRAKILFQRRGSGRAGWRRRSRGGMSKLVRVRNHCDWCGGCFRIYGSPAPEA
jgi:hypothetical protein